VKGFIDHLNVGFCLAIGLARVRGGHLKHDLKVLHELLPEVRCKSTVSVKDNREGVSVNSEYLVQKNLGSLFNIDIFGNRAQVCITTEAIKNNKN
jgi:hypothetical protein